MHVESPNLIMTKQSTSTLSQQANVHAASQPMQISAEGRSDALAWLCLSQLPSTEQTRILAQHYFANIHPLRCFGFIHKPSFMQRLDEGLAFNDKENTLLYIVCALGAKFYALEHNKTANSLTSESIRAAGNQWANTAKRRVLDSFGQVSVENLMAAVLLQDHEIRQGNYASAFMWTGVTARMAHALQINLEFSTDVLCLDSSASPPATVKESRRRLMWACYVLDASVGSGVDQLTLLHERDIKIQLPCDERYFLLQKPCLTETLLPGRVLNFVPQNMIPSEPAGNMGLAAYYLRLIEVRKRVVRYVKHLDTASPPWMADSEFAMLDRDLNSWYSTLPESLLFTSASVYIRTDTGEFGALCSLHATYHATMIDLYRVFVPALYKLRSSFDFPPQQHQFLNQHRLSLFGHSRSLADIVRQAISRDSVKALADFWWPSIVYDSCRQLVYYLTQFSNDTAGKAALAAEVTSLVKSNIKALNLMKVLYAMAEPLSVAAERMLAKAGMARFEGSVVPRDAVDPEEPESPSAPGTPSQSAPDYVLHPLSIYRLARKTISEKHAPEKIPSPLTSTLSPVSVSARTDVTSNPLHVPLTYDGTGMDPSQRLSYEPQQVMFEENIAGGTSIEEELQLNYPLEMTSFWQPAETLADGAYNFDPPSWMGEFPNADTWLDSWPGAPRTQF